MGTTLRVGALLLAFGLPPAAALAQSTTESQTASPNAVITDDGYLGANDGNDGTGPDAGMTCSTLDFSGSAIASVTGASLELAVTHTWIGDLVVKLRSPSGTLLAPLNRPGYTGPDNGLSGPGDSANLTGTSPITFSDDSTKTAESMGDESTLSTYTVCQGAPNNCGYAPSPDGALNSAASFAAFAGEDPDGAWEICLGDAAPLDQGSFVSATLTLTGDPDPPPVCPVDFSASLDPTSLPSQGGLLTFSVAATNNGTATANLQLDLVATGPVNYTRTFGSGSLPAGASVARDFRLILRSQTPDGTYLVDLVLYNDGEVCDTEPFVVTKGTASRMAIAGRTKADAELRDRPDSAVEAVLFEDFAPVHFGAAAARSGAAASPNPFSARTTLAFAVGAAADVRLAVYDVLGREVAVLVDGRVEAGQHTAVFEAGSLAAGTYVYRLAVGGEVSTGRVTIAR